jgi:hypothetical protein
MQTAISSIQTSDTSHDDVVELVELVYRDFNGGVPRARVVRAVQAAAAQYRDARITMYVPMFVRRAAREALTREAASVVRALR